MNVAAWAQTVDAVAEALAQLQPERADDYRSNAAGYREQLAQLDAITSSLRAHLEQQG